MFFRIRAPLIATLVVAVVTAGTAAYVSSNLRDRAVVRVKADVIRAQQVLLRQSRLEGFDLANLANSFAHEDQFVQIFSKPNPDEQQKAAYIEVEVRKARIEKPNPDEKAPADKVGIIGVVDATGRLIARDLQANWRKNEVLTGEFPSLELALKAGANKDIWNLEGAMYRVGAAPIRSPQGVVLGAVFVGFVQSTTDAVAMRELLGSEVGYFLDGKVHASSFEHKDNARSETEEEKGLAGQLFEGSKFADQVVSARQATDAFTIKIGREEWIAAAAPLPGNATPSKSGFVVLKSLKEAESHVAPITGLIAILGLVGIFMILAAWQLTERRFFVALDRLEAGVSEVINGNQEYVFESPSPDFEGLANLMNSMIARLLGRPDPDDEEGDDPQGGGDSGTSRISKMEQMQ